MSRIASPDGSGSAPALAAVVFLLLQALSPGDAHCLSAAWTRTYNGAASGEDRGYGVAVGPAGAVYVTGTTQANGQGADLLLRKYR